MKDTVLDVLIYLFDNYLDDDSAPQPDDDTLTLELREAGFPRNEVEKALSWIAAVADEGGSHLPALHSKQSIRIFSPLEIERLDTESRGYLLYLEQTGILTPKNRELVLDRIMALELEYIDLEQVKWICMMVLFNMPGQEAAYARMEDLVFAQEASVVH